MRVVWNAVLAIAIAGAVIAAVPAFAGWDEDNSTNDGMMSSQPTAAEKGALRDSMLRNQWGTRHTNLYLEQFINSRSRTTIQNLLSYFRGPGAHYDYPNYGGSGGSGTYSTHSGCGGGCLNTNHPRAQ